MRKLTIPLSEDLLTASGQTPEALEDELCFLLAVKLYEMKRLSIGKAADFCGKGKIEFMDALGRLGVPVINLDDDQIQEDLRNA